LSGRRLRYDKTNPRPKIVERKADADFAQRRHFRDHDFDIVDHHAFGEFQNQKPRIGLRCR